MSEEYTVSGLLDPSISEEHASEVLLETVINRGYSLSFGARNDREPIDDLREAREIILSGEHIWMDYRKNDMEFHLHSGGVRKLSSGGDYWILILTVSHKRTYWDSPQYLDELEGLTRDLCDRLPVRLLYATLDPLRVGPNPKFVESSVEEISSLCYFADDVLGNSLREQILDAPVYSITELDDGLCIRVSSTLESSHSKIEEITDVVDLG